MIGVSICPQGGSIFNEGIWNAQKKAWEGGHIPHTREGDEAHSTAFLLGAPSLQAAGCSMQPILRLARASVVLCILHLAMGRLLGEFVDQEAREVAPSVCQELQVLLSERRAGWNVYGSASLDGEEFSFHQIGQTESGKARGRVQSKYRFSADGEETANFYKVWPNIARCLNIRPGSAKYKAVTKMWDLLQALY